MSGHSTSVAGLDPRRRQLIEQVLRARRAAPAPAPIPRRERADAPLPLSFAQERLWLLDRIDPGGAAYHEAYVVDLPAAGAGTLEPAALAAALAAVVRRHEGLRTRFPAVDGRGVQVVEPPAPVPLPLVDLAAVPAPRAAAEARRIAAAEAARPFDISAAPPLRARLLQLAAGRHRLVVVLHHVICDARSLGIFFAEIESLYAAACGGLPDPLPPPALHYPDFALWQRHPRTSAAIEGRVAAWSRRLADFPAVLEVPSDLPREGALGEGTNRQVELAIPEEVSEALRAIARDAGSTPYMAFLALFAAFLARLTGSSRLLLGSPAAGRPRAELEGTIGFFVDTLVLPLDTGGDPGFADLLVRVRATTLEALDHQDVPFARLVEELKPERRAAGRPLVQVFFLLQRRGQAGLPAGEVSPNGLPFRPRRLEAGAAKFDLTLVIDDDDVRFGGHLDYDSGLFLPVTAARWAASFLALAAAAVAEPSRPLATLPLFSTAERRRVLGAWRGRAEPSPPPSPVLADLAWQVERDPSAPALVAADRRTVTYGELAAHVGRLATRLRLAGVGLEVPIAIAAERTPETVVALLAVLAAGGAWVPFAPDLPAARRDAMLAAAGVGCVLATRRQRPLLSGVAADLIEVPEVDGAPADGETGIAPPPPAASWPGAAADPRALAYVVHTSGSTGEPKGVMVEHGALARLTAAFREALALAPADRLLMVPAPTFDASIGNVFPVLTAGAALVLHPDPGSLPPEELGRLVERLGVTVVDVPTAFWTQWVDALAAGEAAAPRGLRLVIAGGESVDVERVAAWERVSGAAFFGPYGPTEATVAATAFLTRPGWRREARRPRLPIGRPLPHAAVVLVDHHGEPVADGAAGELAIGGGALARGYRGRPGETADRFRPDPHGGPGARRYHTGDLARWLADGDVEFLGRLDEQVKVRGFRIEPGEVELALRRHPGVRDAAVVARESAGGARLVAYVVGENGDAPAASELAAFLGGILPGPLVPSAFVRLARLPLTAHGKVDRRALPDPETAAQAAAEPVAPRDEREALLVRLWSEVLGRGQVGVDDDFFQLGGDSIVALRVASRARAAGLAITPKQLFEHRTPAALAAVAGAVVPAAVAEPVRGPVPATPIQLWLLELDPVDLHHWNQANVWELPPGTRAGDWRRALAALVEHHDALRLRLVRDAAAPGGWRQEIAAAGPPVVVEVDLAALPGERREAAWARAATAAQGSLDLSRAPLLALVLGRRGEGGDRLLLTIHHLAVDAVSWTVIATDLEDAYRRVAADRTPRLPPATTPFSAWARRLAAWAASGELDGERASWRAQATVELPPLPRDGSAVASAVRDAGAGRVGAATRLTGELDPTATAALVDALPEAFGATVEEALLAALALAFQRWTGERRLRVQLEGHGREDLFPDLDPSRTVGWFTAAYPLVLTLPAGGGPGAAVKAIKEQVRAIPRRGVGWGALRYLAPGGEELAGGAPEVAVKYLGRAGEGTSGDLLRPSAAAVGPVFSPRGRRPFPFEVDAGLVGDRLLTRWTWSPSLHLPATVAGLSARLLEHLGAIATEARAASSRDHTPSDFPLAGLDRRGLDKLSALLSRTDSAGGAE